jgi:cytochrome b6-f complex iron-sulfur subunit
MAEPKKMTTAEILAAARAGKKPAATESPAPEAAAPPSEAPSASAEPTPAAPPSAAPARPAPGQKLSVAEMMALARAQKGGGAAPAASAPAAPKPAQAKPAAKETPKPAVKPAATKPAAAAAPAAPMDTSSILASARSATKPGPMTKAEAALKAPPKPAAREEKPKRIVPPMPVKPEYAKPKPAPVDESRRQALLGIVLGSSLGVGFTSLAATFGLWTLGTARFMFPNVLTEPPSKFKVGPPANFVPGQVETKYVAQYGVWIANWEYNGQNQIYALKTVCTHLGCTPNWLEGEQKFKCPCHGSGFYKDGINFEGPAPRPLERYAIRLADDGQIEIDKSKTFQEELGQWADPASFVAV